MLSLFSSGQPKGSFGALLADNFGKNLAERLSVFERPFCLLAEMASFGKNTFLAESYSFGKSLLTGHDWQKSGRSRRSRQLF